VQAVILAAGKGTRMRSSRPKVLHEVLGRPLLESALRLTEQLGCRAITVVVGHGAREVEESFRGRAAFVRQDPPLGTGHALASARDSFCDPPRGTLLVLGADMPLLRLETLEGLLEAHTSSGAALTLLSGRLEDPGAYGRIIRSAQGAVERIVEARDASAEQIAIREINAGVYAVEVAPLLPALDGLGTDNAQGEYYLTDVVRHLVESGAPVGAFAAKDPSEILGVNTQAERALASSVLRRRRALELMEDGVIIEDPESTWIGVDVRVEADAIVRPYTFLEGHTIVRTGAQIGPCARLRDVEVGPGARVLDHCVLLESRVEAGAQVGPFAHVRPGSRIGPGARVGNFVELKKTDLGRGSKASHLSYLGDANIGTDVNIGAGTITCNYDGETKHVTRIDDGAFIGSDSVLVAPVSVGHGAYVGAGSVITRDVEAESLALGRAHQVEKRGWVAKRRAQRRPASD